MKKTVKSVQKTANYIADLITAGLEINVESSNAVKMVSVRNPRNGDIEEFAFKVPSFGVSMFDHETREYLEKHGYKGMAPQRPVKKAAKPISEKKKSAKWWSRFHFEKNIMRMTLLALQDRYPAQVSFTQAMFAEKLARMMDWQTSTARKHITQAAKLGILNRAVIGTAYHVTGINDEPQETLKQNRPEEMPLPFADLDEEENPAPSSALAEEGRPLHELELEKAVDESILP